jgi:hypothetical protein
VIGEQFNLVPDCNPNAGLACNSAPPPFLPPKVSPASYLQYLPGQVLGFPIAVPSCGTANLYQEAVAGCDQSTPYQCGVQSSVLGSPNQVELNENPSGFAGDTSTATQCLIHQTAGQDVLATGAYPYQIQAGAGNPLNVGTSVITSSNSIVTFPIYDDGQALVINGSNNANVTIVGFLQVFINQANADGSLNVTVLNVAGCSNAVPAGTPYLTGTSPVPIRLITAP